METAELLKKVRKIEIKTRDISKNLFAGEYHSAFKGRGMSFSEVRSYQYGDDIRNIDWNVTARTGDPYVKVFEEERELTVSILVDISSSTFFGTSTQKTNELITELCAVLAYSAIQNNDKVALVLFAEKVELYIPPKKGKRHILRIIRELLGQDDAPRSTDINEVLKYYNNIMKKKSICFVISDFHDASFEASLNVLSKKHDVVGMHMFDPVEAKLPKLGLWQMKDAETGLYKWVDTNDQNMRNAYEKQFVNKQEHLQKTFNKAGAEFMSIEVGMDYTKILRQFFKKRGH